MEQSSKEKEDLIVSYLDRSRKSEKLILKASDAKERDRWIKVISEAIAIAESSQEAYDNDPLVQPFKDNLYEAFSSKMFVDECDFDNKL